MISSTQTKPDKRVPAGFARCWCCGRVVPTYMKRTQTVLGKTELTRCFKKHIAPKLREFSQAGFTVTSIWCIKSNAFA